MLRFLVDESTGREVARLMVETGHDVVYVGDVIPRADDEQVLARAKSEGRILITNDKDFGEKVFRERRLHTGILLLRLSDERVANKVRVARAVIEQYGDRLPGNFVVATEDRVRVRRPVH